MTASLASVFEFLFKYRPVVFERGALTFVTGWTTWLAIGLVLLLAVPAIVSTARLRAGVTRRDRVVLAALRLAVLAILLTCLARPALLLSVSAPQRNVVAVLFDDSRSMSIRDEGGADDERREAVQRRFAADAALMRALGERFAVRSYGFAASARRITGAEGLTAAGGRSSLGDAIRQVRQELAGVPLAGIVLVSDGADNGDSTLVGAASGRSVDGTAVPIYTVGVGADLPRRDVELVRVEGPRRALAGGTAMVEATVVQHGLRGEAVRLVAESDGRVVAERRLVLPADGMLQTVQFPVELDDEGMRQLSLRVIPHDRELLTQNNARDVLVDVRGGRERMLYVEGEPRFEFKFARAAVADDEHLQLVGLQRTAENKFLRLDVSDSLELVGGFPTTPEELFAYRVVVLGSMEASYFTASQLRLLVDYVSERGGAILFLGGRRSFGEGGYAGTPLAELMPVTFDDRRGGEEPEVVEVRVTPTAAGLAHTVTQVTAIPDSSAARWDSLPALTSVNRVTGVRPGATVLLADGAGADATPVLAWQRYGRGEAAALVVQDTWLWQMDASIPVEDQTHERFWRQLLRWLDSGVEDRTTLVASTERVQAGDGPVSLRATVRDSAYHEMENAIVRAVVRSPSGAEQSVLLTGVGGGEYLGAFSPLEDGAYEARLEMEDGWGAGGARAMVVRASDGSDEFFGASRREPLLRQLASESGGRYYRLGDADALAREIMYTDSGNTVMERKDLWDMPVVLLLLVGLLSADWGYRRMRGAV